jgi:hypothetical protein
MLYILGVKGDLPPIAKMSKVGGKRIVELVGTLDWSVMRCHGAIVNASHATQSAVQCVFSSLKVMACFGLGILRLSG